MDPAAQEVAEAAAERPVPRGSRARPRRGCPVPPRQGRLLGALCPRIRRDPASPALPPGPGSVGPHAPCGKPGIPRGTHPPASVCATIAYLAGARAQVYRRPPESAGHSAVPLVQSRRAELSAPPRSAGHTQQPTPQPGLGRGRGSRREARGTRRAGPARTRRGRAQTLERARPGRGAKRAGTDSSLCFLFSLWFPARRRKTLIPGSFVFLSAWRLDAGSYF